LPDFTLETALAERHGGPIAGVDEVGRGPWAGPVLAAAVILRPDAPEGLLGALNDSKKLTVRKREALAAAIPACAWIGVGAASVAEIDRLNILAASHLAMSRAVARLPEAPSACLVDGNRLPDLPCPAEAVVKGDSRSLSIAAASIIAKVLRDRLMARLAVRYPAYFWQNNAGYGTKAHRDGLADAGVTAHHRRSFAPIRIRLEKQSGKQGY
jgi:ribonuclease HII